MDRPIQKAFVAGYERLVSWTDLLDQINVFPVADSDTGRNLRISLAPLRRLNGDSEAIGKNLLLAATGNSGNIANRFMNGFLAFTGDSGLREAAAAGRDGAWQAVVDPKPGTMLTVFDALKEYLDREPYRHEAAFADAVTGHLEQAVRSTTELLPVLKRAGVIDAGALGMFIFLEGFFRTLAGQKGDFRPITEVFQGSLTVRDTYRSGNQEGYCVDTLVALTPESTGAVEELSNCSESVVITARDSMVKIHLHTADREAVRSKLASLGTVVHWSEEQLVDRIEENPMQAGGGVIHVMTDAAGSITQEDARQLGVTLLDSYLLVGERCLPETLVAPEELYASMRDGIKVSTAQASDFERHQCYESVLNRFDRVLYLCVGSVYTGNYDVVSAWKREHDTEGRLQVIDTTAASGRLGLIAMATARFAAQAEDAEAVIEYAEKSVAECREFVFLERLKYLVAGGRISRTSGFFGDLLHMKPVISPTAEGAKKVGVVKNQKEQVAFALQKLAENFSAEAALVIMLEYSDNRSWVEKAVKTEIADRYPRAEIFLQPLSRTSGAHMGPGTWGMAFLPTEV